MIKTTNIPVMFCFDTNYVIPAAVAFYSLMEHANKEYNYTFYVLHSDITEYQQLKLKDTLKEFKNCKLEFIDMNHKLDDFWENNYKGGHFSKEVMYKLLVSSIFPNLDKIIVSDVDVVFLGDITESYFAIDTDDKEYIAGVKPIGKVASYLQNYKGLWTEEEIDKLGEICGGYLVMNLKKIREDNMENVFLDSLEKDGYRLNQMEQDIFNITCYGKIKHLHLKYVACSYMWDYYKTKEDMKTDINYKEIEIKEAMENPVQLHYATSTKPWKNPDCTKADIWFKYIVKTPFLNDYLKDLPNKIQVPEHRINPITNVYKENILKNILSKIKSIIKSLPLLFKKSFYKSLYYKIFEKKFFDDFSLIILDDIFPSEMSPFRYEEFMYYFKKFNYTYAATTGKSMSLLEEKNSVNDIISDFENKHPNLKGRIYNISLKNRKEVLNKITKLRNPLAVIVFNQNMINDTYNNLQFLEENNIPFIFTLYPGGGFIINNKESDEKLKNIFNSRFFRKVIVTQEFTREYLLNNNFCPEEKIENIYGIVTPSSILKSNKLKKEFYGKRKSNLDILFVGHKYCDKGKDKGYDLFIETAKELSKKYKNIKFHVVGGFTKEDIDIKEIENQINFYGILKTEDLKKLYKNIDVILSPTRPFQLSKGSFDGFPTGASTEAMINEVVLLATDELNQNKYFKNNKEIIIIKPDVKNIIEKIDYLYNNNFKIKQIAKKGSKKAKRMYSENAQLKRRKKLILEVAYQEYKK